MMTKNLLLLLFLLSSSASFCQLVWHHTDGPEGTLDAFITSTDSLAFVSTDDFLFTLEKGDTTWSKTPFDGPQKWVIEDNFFVGLHTDTRTDTFSFHLKTSEDLGKNWSSIDLTHSIPNSHVVAVIDSGIFVLEVNGYYMYHTVDTGLNWDTIRLPGSYGHYLQTFDNRLYLNNDQELWISDSTGLNWHDISPPNGCTKHIEVVDSLILSIGQNRICRSTDLGKTWSSISINTQSNQELQIVDSLVYYYNLNLHQSKDFGLTWEKLADDIDFPNIHYMAEFNNQLYISSYEQGIFRWDTASQNSSAGTFGLSNFIEANNGIGKAQIHEMASTKNRIYTATTNGLFIYDIMNNHWSELFHLIGDYYNKSVDCNDNGWVVYSPDSRGFFLFSEDHAQTWDTIYTDYYNALAVEQVKLIGNTIYVFENGSGLFSTDKGLTWNTFQITPNVIEFIPFKGAIYTTTFTRLHHTLDDGLNWDRLKLDFDIDQLMSTEDYLFILSRFNTDPAKLYVSPDGLSWTEITQNLPPSIARFPNEEQFFVSKGDSSFYLFWGEHGIYETTDTFQSWNLVLPGFYGEHFLIQDSTLFMGDEGVYRSDLKEMISSLNEIHSDAPMNALDIYPNPNSGRLTISVDQAIPTEGVMHIYKCNGSLMKKTWLKNISSYNPISLDLMEQGVYYILIHSQEKSWIGKTIVNRKN